MKTFILTARPLPSCLAYPWEADLLKCKSVTVQLTCCTMGKINRNKIHRLVMPELQKQFGHLCRIGGYTCGEPVEACEASETVTVLASRRSAANQFDWTPSAISGMKETVVSGSSTFLPTGSPPAPPWRLLPGV